MQTLATPVSDAPVPAAILVPETLEPALSDALEIAGQVDGNIADHEVVVLEGAVVRGELGGERIVIRGRVDGTVRASDVVIDGTAVVDGEIHFDTLTVAEGARVEARCIPW